MLHEAERRQARPPLLALFTIYKAMLGLNNEKLLEVLLSDDAYLDTFGCLERKCLSHL